MGTSRWAGEPSSGSGQCKTTARVNACHGSVASLAVVITLGMTLVLSIERFTIAVSADTEDASPGDGTTRTCMRRVMCNAE